MSRQNLTIGGVPEHFNLPWQLAMEDGAFERAGVDIEYHDFPGGTGAMTQALRSNKLDMAILLTEGAIADIALGSGGRIVKVFVESALIWGIHVASSSAIESVDQIRGKRYAISRFGSGSHLMAIVDAAERCWPTDEMIFIPVGNLSGARDALADGSADIFFWERFTTSPYVESGEFRRVGDRLTPWPAFVVCVGENALDAQANAIKTVLDVVNDYCVDLMANDKACELIANRYSLAISEVEAWFSQTQWCTDFRTPTEALDRVFAYLKRVNIIASENDNLDSIWFDLGSK